MNKKRIFKQRQEKRKKIAAERIKELFKQADEAFDESPELSNKYVNLARKMAMKYRVKIPTNLKRRFCKHCYSYFKQGKTCRVRLNKGKMVYYCLKCKKYTRIPYKK
jgi:ribonuclease P protein subunit RPR2